MAINKVIYGDETLIDLTEDTVSSGVLAKGVTAHRRDGVVIEGELDLEGMIADEYDSTATYSVGDYVLYEGVLYQCITDISTPEEWNTEHWEAVTVTDELKEKADISEVANIYNLISQLHNDNPTWNDVQALVRSGHAREAFPIGTVFEVTRTGQDTLYKVVADYDNPNYTLSASGHNMILLDVYAIYSKQFDARQALLYFPEAVEGNVTMNFLVKGAYYSDDNNKYIQFTSPADGITAESQLVLSNVYNATMIGMNAKLYTGFSDTTGVNVELSQGNSGTYIGQTNGTAAGTIELNHVTRAVLGSNNYGESAIDQWVNSDAAANAWQTQRTHFQRPAAYANLAGYMNGMDPDFLNVLAETDVICRSNNVFELDGELNKLYIITNRKFFLASRVELGYGAENNLYEGRVFELYATATDANKIKYDISYNSTARAWWLRSPNPSNAYNARRVDASGSLYSNNASGGLGAVSACVIC